MTDFTIDVRDLRKSFGARKVVSGLTLQLGRGEICGFLGANGSGKTTTIRMLCGLLVPDGGSGTCLGHDIIREASLIRRGAGYMMQKFSFYEDLTVFENLDLVASVYDVPNRRETVAGIMDRMRLADRRDQLAGQLSGGWKQRLALAACVLHQPMLLLLDEPTAGVDAKARREFWDLAANQMQAIQFAQFTLLPSLLLSGFMFPFKGMPVWAQWAGEIIPATHAMRVVRGLLLKGNGLPEILPELWPIALFALAAIMIAVWFYRETLD